MHYDIVVVHMPHVSHVSHMPPPCISITQNIQPGNAAYAQMSQQCRDAGTAWAKMKGAPCIAEFKFDGMCCCCVLLCVWVFVLLHVLVAVCVHVHSPLTPPRFSLSLLHALHTPPLHTPPLHAPHPTGFRVMLHRDDAGTLHYFTRQGHNFRDRNQYHYLDDIVEEQLVSVIPFVLDGELCVWNKARCVC